MRHSPIAVAANAPRATVSALVSGGGGGGGGGSVRDWRLWRGMSAAQVEGVWQMTPDGMTFHSSDTLGGLLGCAGQSSCQRCIQ